MNATNPLYPNGPMILALRCDRRIPATAEGYVDDLANPHSCPAAIDDAVGQLARYVPEIRDIIGVKL